MDSLFQDHEVNQVKFDLFRGRLVEFLARPTVTRFQSLINSAISLSMSSEFLRDFMTKFINQTRTVDLLCLYDDPPITLSNGHVFVKGVAYQFSSTTSQEVSDFTYGFIHLFRSILSAALRQKIFNIIEDGSKLEPSILSDALLCVSDSDMVRHYQAISNLIKGVRKDE